MDAETIKCNITKALNKLLTNDKILLIVDANERSITHMLAIYLQEEFTHDYNVDCEYNRNLHETKLIKFDYFKKCFPDMSFKGLKRPRSDDPNGITVFPDIIIHNRYSAENLIAIEVKKTTSQRTKGKFDKAKLDIFRNDKGLGYEYSLFIKIKTISRKEFNNINKPNSKYKIGICELELKYKTHEENLWKCPEGFLVYIDKNNIMDKPARN